MRWSILTIVLALCAQVLPQHRPPRKIACKTAENRASCYWVHGRLSFYNGTPAYRLWKIGTNRLLGIYSGPGAERHDPLDNEHPELPANLPVGYDAWAYGDFEVCPLAPERAGFMQPVCIESAKNIRVEKSK
jgi:hypothetical protein